jgi:hypothetical protein
LRVIGGPTGHLINRQALFHHDLSRVPVTKAPLRGA